MPFYLWNWTRALGVPDEAMAGWRDVDIRSEIASAYDFPVYLENDASSACAAEVELEFVHAGAAAEARRRRRRKLWVSGVVAASLLIAAVMGVLAFREASSRQLADRQVSRYLARQAEDRLMSELDLALLLGVKAYRTAPTFEATSVLLSALKSTPRLTSYLPGATSTVQAVDIDPTGTLVAFGGHDQTLRLWHLERQRIECQRPLPATGAEGAGVKNWIGGLAFGPEGDVLVSGSDDGVVRRWRVSGCEPEAELGRHLKKVTGLAAAGGWVVSGGNDGAVKLLSIDGEAAFDLGELPGGVRSVAASGDGRRAAAGGFDGTIEVWDLERRAPVGRVARRHDGAVTALALSADGRFLASGSGDGVAPLRLWDLESPAPERSLEAPPHAGLVSSLAFSGDGTVLASGSRSGEIRVWKVSEPGRRLVIGGQGNPVHSVALDPRDATRLVSASGDRGSVRLWNVALPGDENLQGLVAPASLAYGPAGRRLVVVDEGTARFLDPEIGAPEGERFSRSEAGEEVTTVAYGGDDGFLATGGDDGVVRLWGPVSRDLRPLPAGHGAAVNAVAFSADGELVASGGQDSGVRLWSVADLRLRFEAEHDDWVNAVAFSPDGEILASGGDDGTVKLWSVASGELLATPVAPDPQAAFPASVKSLAFSRTGLLAAALDDGRVRLLSRRLEPMQPPIRLAQDASAVAFSARGRMLAAGSSSGGLELFRLESGTPFGGSAAARPSPLATIEDDNGISALAFHPGRALLAIVRTGSAEILDLTGIEAWAARACRRAHRDLSEEEWQEFIGADVPQRRVCPARYEPE